MDVTRRSPYVLLDAFKLRTIRMGALLYLLLMVINSSAMFVNVFAGVGMHLDNLQNASLGNWCMVGYAIGAVIAMVLGGKGLHFKYLFAMGFFFLSLSAVFMYFEVQTAGVYERLKYAVIIRATGMMILYALTAAYANQRMPFKYPFHLDLYYAYCAYGCGTEYRRSNLYKCFAGAATTLYNPLCAKCGPA